MRDQDLVGGRIQTERLSLQRPVEADIGAILSIHRDPETCRHNPSDALTRLEEAAALYRRWDAQWQRHGFGYWVVRRRDSPRHIGFCRIKPTELHGTETLNLFYRFTPAVWGHGFAAEAATAVVGWVSRNAPHLPLIARIRPANIASQRVAISAGLSRMPLLDTTGHDGLDWIYAATSHLTEPHPPFRVDG
ncbi:GNAT family N-acetyltransferase [Streptomyces sp. NPDC002564]|uniref:GNAT family N-acetyltransferase n=1 Tax=Streptomyces sp. NPDC002564 TaxID=3364649 RepID=UPI0036C0176C